MPTFEEIRTEWKGVRSALGNLICYMDGKIQQLQSLGNAYEKGYDEGSANAFGNGYDAGLKAAWEAAIRLTFNMTEREAEKALGVDYAPTALKRITPQEAIQKLKEYDAIMHRVAHSNAQKFVEVFGFAPGYEILDDGREVYPSLNDEFWNAEYKPPEEEAEV